jgi:hypothetical protein
LTAKALFVGQNLEKSKKEPWQMIQVFGRDCPDEEARGNGT